MKLENSKIQKFKNSQFKVKKDKYNKSRLYKYIPLIHKI
jgi:hypothetical protein